MRTHEEEVRKLREAHDAEVEKLRELHRKATLPSSTSIAVLDAERAKVREAQRRELDARNRVDLMHETFQRLSDNFIHALETWESTAAISSAPAEHANISPEATPSNMRTRTPAAVKPSPSTAAAMIIDSAAASSIDVNTIISQTGSTPSALDSHQPRTGDDTEKKRKRSAGDRASRQRSPSLDASNGAAAAAAAPQMRNSSAERASKRR